MKLGMLQMYMSDDMHKNQHKILQYVDKAQDCDLLFFPEIQYSPFFPQYKDKNASSYLMSINHPFIQQLSQKCQDYHMYISPNIYLKENYKCYDASLFINPSGKIEGISKMVHIIQAKYFYEKDYYTASDDGFKVYDTPFGKIGIVICFDRHIPESIRTCVLKGADLIIIPTANCKQEDMTMFEWEIRVQSMQNQVFIAMCNRVGVEDCMNFAGESLIVNPNGDILYKANDQEELIKYDIQLSLTQQYRNEKTYFYARRKDMYER
ncbi:MAG: carbon-nitrogen hydrolase family protein [Erysipelotrichaceae bacterium]|nr:carbon-nitrogen hydrolase family protein [Erysipelotrichaceae bacterium]